MLSLASVLLVALSVTVDATPQTPPKFDTSLRTVKLGDQLHLLEGAGGNVLVYVWDDGVLLVDDKLPPSSASLKAALAADGAERPRREWDASMTRSFVTPDHVIEEAWREVCKLNCASQK